MIFKIVFPLIIALNAVTMIRSDDSSLSAMGIILFLVSVPLFFMALVKYFRSSK